MKKLLIIVLLFWGCELNWFPEQEFILVEWISIPGTNGWLCYTTTDSCHVSYKEPTLVFNCDTIKYQTNTNLPMVALYSNDGDTTDYQIHASYLHDCGCANFDYRGECDDCYPERYAVISSLSPDTEMSGGWHMNLSGEDWPELDCTVRSCVYEVLP